MRARKTRLIIQVSSIAGRAAFPGFGVYHASKWGLEGISETMVMEAFSTEDAPTDPMIVVETFEALINMPAGQRPLRIIAGMDFGLQAVNDAVEPIRKELLSMMQISDLDGPSSMSAEG